MRQISRLTVLLIALFINSFSQQCEIIITKAPERAFLFSVEGENYSLLDSLTNQNNAFKFSLTKTHEGFYALGLNNKKFFFINDGRPILIQTSFPALYDSVRVLRSEQNKTYFSFLRANKDFREKNKALINLLDTYPKKEPFYNVALNEFYKLQKNYSDEIENLINNSRNTFIARYIASARIPVSDKFMDKKQRENYFKRHALDFVDFSDTTLLHSNLFTDKTIDYLSYFKHANLEEELIHASDTLLKKASVNQKVFAQIFEYLLKGFHTYKFDNAVSYLIGKYVPNSDFIQPQQFSGILKEMVSQEIFLGIGKKAKEIELKDTAGKIVKLSDVKANYILLVFYASWCRHCQKALPELYKIYNSQKEKKIEIYGVSLDKEKNAWLNFIRKNKMNWINVSDLQGWESKAAKNYYVYATPTIFFLDNNLKIIAKPPDIQAVKNLFEMYSE